MEGRFFVEFKSVDGKWSFILRCMSFRAKRSGVEKSTHDRFILADIQCQDPSTRLRLPRDDNTITIIYCTARSDTPERTRYIMVLIPSSRNQSTCHRNIESGIPPMAGDPKQTRYIMVSLRSSPQWATLHWAVAFKWFESLSESANKKRHPNGWRFLLCLLDTMGAICIYRYLPLDTVKIFLFVCKFRRLFWSKSYHIIFNYLILFDFPQNQKIPCSIMAVATFLKPARLAPATRL